MFLSLPTCHLCEERKSCLLALHHLCVTRCPRNCRRHSFFLRWITEWGRSSFWKETYIRVWNMSLLARLPSECTDCGLIVHYLLFIITTDPSTYNTIIKYQWISHSIIPGALLTQLVLVDVTDFVPAGLHTVKTVIATTLHEWLQV